MTGRGVSASQEMRAIRRGQAEAAVAAAEAAVVAARTQLDDLAAAESDRLTWELLLALQPYTISNHRWLLRTAPAPPIPQQRTVASWLETQRERNRERELRRLSTQPPATERRWRG